MVAASTLRARALQDVKFTIVGEEFTIFIAPEAASVDDCTQNVAPVEEIHATREEIEGLVRLNGGQLVPEEGPGILAVVGNVQNQLEQYDVEAKGARVLDPTTLLDAISNFYDGSLSRKIILSAIYIRHSRSKNPLRDQPLFHVAGAQFDGELTYPPGAENDPSWGLLRLTPGELCFLITGSIKWRYSHTVGPGVHVIYGRDVPAPQVAQFIDLGAICHDVDNIMRRVIATNPSLPLSTTYRLVKTYRNFMAERKGVSATIIKEQSFRVATGTFIVPTALRPLLSVDAVNEAFIKKLVPGLGGYVASQSNTAATILVGDDDYAVAKHILDHSGATSWTLTHLWDALNALHGAEATLEQAKIAIDHIGLELHTVDSTKMKGEVTRRSGSSNSSTDALQAATEVPITQVAAPPPDHNATFSEQVNGPGWPQVNDESPHDEYADTRGVQEEYFEQEEEEPTEYPAGPEENDEDGVNEPSVVGHFQAVKSQMEAYYNSRKLSGEWWKNVAPLALRRHTEDVLDLLFGPRHFPIQYDANVENMEEWRTTERHVAGALAELQIVRMLVMDSSRSERRPLLDTQMYDISTQVSPAEHALAELMSTQRVSLKLLLVTAHRQSLELLNKVLAEMEAISTFRLEVKRPGLYIYAQQLRETVREALGGKALRGLYAGSAVGCCAKRMSQHCRQSYRDSNRLAGLPNYAYTKSFPIGFAGIPNDVSPAFFFDRHRDTNQVHRIFPWYPQARQMILYKEMILIDAGFLLDVDRDIRCMFKARELRTRTAEAYKTLQIAKPPAADGWTGLNALTGWEVPPTQIHQFRNYDRDPELDADIVRRLWQDEMPVTGSNDRDAAVQSLLGQSFHWLPAEVEEWFPDGAEPATRTLLYSVRLHPEVSATRRFGLREEELQIHVRSPHIGPGFTRSFLSTELPDRWTKPMKSFLRHFITTLHEVLNIRGIDIPQLPLEPSSAQAAAQSIQLAPVAPAADSQPATEPIDLLTELHVGALKNSGKRLRHDVMNMLQSIHPATIVTPSAGQFTHSFNLKPEVTGVHTVWSGIVPTSTPALPILSFKPLGIRLAWTDATGKAHHHQLPQHAAVVQHVRAHVLRHQQEWQPIIDLELLRLPALAPYHKELENFEIEGRKTVVHSVLDPYLQAEPGQGGMLQLTCNAKDDKRAKQVRVQIDNTAYRSSLQRRFYRNGLLWLSSNLNKFEFFVMRMDDHTDTANIWGNVTTQLYAAFLEATPELLPLLVTRSEARLKREAHARSTTAEVARISQLVSQYPPSFSHPFGMGMTGLPDTPMTDRLTVWDLEIIAQMLHPQGLKRTASVVAAQWRIDVSVGQGNRPLHVYIPAGPTPAPAADGAPGERVVYLHMIWSDEEPSTMPAFTVEYADGTFVDEQRMARSIGIGKVTRTIFKYSKMVSRAIQQRRRMLVQEETARIFGEMVRSGHTAPVYGHNHGKGIRFILNRSRKEIWFEKAALRDVELLDNNARVHIAEFERERFWILTNLAGITLECQPWSSSVIDISLGRTFDAWVQSHNVTVPALFALPIRGTRYTLPRNTHA